MNNNRLNIKKDKFSSLFLNGAFFVGALIIIFLVIVCYKQLKEVTKSEAIITHSHLVNSKLEKLISLVKDGETSQSCYLLTSDSIFIKSHNKLKSKIENSFLELKSLLSDNKIQIQNLNSLRILVDKKFVILQKTIKIHNVNASKESLIKNLYIGKITMDNIEVKANEMINVEMKLLIQRNANFIFVKEYSPKLFLAVTFFIIFIFVSAYFKINFDIKKLTKSNNDLLINRETFEHAEQIAKISSWSYNTNSKKIYFSDNVFRMLGFEPNEFPSTMEGYMEFILPEDRQIIIDGMNEATEKDKPSLTFYRIKRKDGEIRFMKSSGKTIIDNYGNKLRIGVNSDITEQNKKDRILEEKIFDLERSNNELLSFNHVASHDLQEPLRKIQTFISRIFSDQENSFSAKSTEYFAKTQTAANKMQKLIDDLLQFSRTNKSNKVLKISDLNQLLESTKQEIAHLIEEKNAIIESDNLPTLDVIPFQIQQLFSNLIGNSLKYSKDSVKPVIKIKYELVDGGIIPNYVNINNLSFHKISITDNGIGFDQQYASTIFVLFQRLHKESNYQGTGIGLTICKKIVENHKGFIFAESKPNEGSKFTFFIPS
ncbi:MAG: CHASE3 domain-containing protein [Flavobacterium sp.]|nr:CHASE3 domain-containing protein [Flavobacterium sp.]